MANMPLTAAQSQVISNGYAKGMAQYKATGSFNGQTPAQNLNNVLQQPGNTQVNNPVNQPIIAQAAKDSAMPATTGGGFVKVGTLGNTPNTGGQTPPSSTGSVAPPKFDAYGIAASKVAAQRAAMANSVAAYDASRKQGFDYVTKNTQDQRVLDAAMFHEQNNPFSGKYQYDKTNILRNNGIQDTQNQMQYNNDIAASDAKLQAFDANSAGLTQDLQQQLEHQYLTDNIAQAGVTGQYDGSPTLAAQGQQFNQGIAQAGLTGNYNGSPTMEAKNQQFQQGISQAGLTGQYNGQQTLAGQNAALNNTQVMAQLTGKMPDGTPTNAAQQQQLANQWTAAEQTGTIPNSLADFYGLPHGMQTQAAKNQAAQISISQQNANTSAQSANNSYQLGLGNQAISQQNADTNTANSQRADSQAGVDNLYKAWTESGKAPAGIPGVAEGTSLYDRTAAQKEVADAYKTWNETGIAPVGIPGVAPGTPKVNATTARYQGMNENEASITQQLDSVPKANVKAALQGEKSAILNKVGATGYQKIYNMYFDSFGNPK